jgi:calcium-dependent protein kinase
VHHPTGIQRAIKVVKKKNMNQLYHEKLLKEIILLKALDHPNIIKLHEYYLDDGQVYMVMELCTGGTLH